MMAAKHEATNTEALVWYFTFGVDHPLQGKVQPVRGSYQEAREKMFAIYGHNWCSQLSRQEAAEQIGAYGYQLLPEVE